ncbi:Major facilitator superfamily - like 10 [Theobroma cacao]|nr:Major facilitator superfamily - like 10 [Theobroma cacao]
MEKKLTASSHLFVTVFLSGFATFIVIPAITDVTMFALCPGTDECSLAIYLSGLQQAVHDRTGDGLDDATDWESVGSIRKKSSAHITYDFVHYSPWYFTLNRVGAEKSVGRFFQRMPSGMSFTGTLTAMICEGSINCLALAYLADNISDSQRASAFGILSGVSSGAFVCGTLAARFLSTGSTFQVATFVSMLAVVYMRIFLEESIPDQVDGMTQPILKEGEDLIQKDGNAPRKMPVFKKIPSVGDIISLLKSSPSFSQAAVVAFFNSLAEGGMISSLMFYACAYHILKYNLVIKQIKVSFEKFSTMQYYLKARFHFNKNQFADLMLIAGIISTISQLFLMPLLVSPLGDGKLLSIGLLVSCANAILYSIAWSDWVPYAATALSIMMVFAPPSLRSIASKQAGAREQGKAQGCISGISSLANIIAPLVFSPLTALFLSEDAPFHFPGFSIICIAITLMIAFIQSLMIGSAPSTSSDKNSSNCMEV